MSLHKISRKRIIEEMLDVKKKKREDKKKEETRGNVYRVGGKEERND